MKTPLQQKGWEQMKNILDNEMPVKEKKYRIPVWITLLLVSSGFVSGYLFHQLDTKKQYQETPLLINTAKSEVFEKNAVQKIPSNTKELKREEDDFKPSTPTARLTKKNIISDQILPGDSKESNVYMTAQSQSSDYLENQPEIQQTNELKSESNPFMRQNDGKEIDLLHGPDLQFLKTGFILTLQIDPSKKPSYLSHNFVFSGGSFVQKPTSKSLGVSYLLDYKTNRWSSFTSLGYRYIKYDIHEVIDTIIERNASSFSGNSQQYFTLNYMHQLILGLGMTYTFEKNYVMRAGFNLPYSFQNQGFFQKDYSKLLQDSNDPTLNPSESYNLQTTSNNSFHSFDIQPFIGVGVKISKKSNIYVTYEHGLLPINRPALFHSKNLLFQQLGIQWQYALSSTKF